MRVPEPESESDLTPTSTAIVLLLNSPWGTGPYATEVVLTVAVDPSSLPLKVPAITFSKTMLWAANSPWGFAPSVMSALPWKAPAEDVMVTAHSPRTSGALAEAAVGRAASRTQASSSPTGAVIRVQRMRRVL